MNTTFTLPRPLVNDLLHQAQISPDTEVCGVVSTDNKHRHQVYPVTNVSTEPGRLFEMDEQQLIDNMRDMRQKHESLFAIYHSHPHGPASPSEEDFSRAAYPEALYLIIALGTEGVLEMRGYQLMQNVFQEVHLEIE